MGTVYLMTVLLRSASDTQPLPSFSTAEATRAWLAAIPPAPPLRAVRTPESVATTTRLPVTRGAAKAASTYVHWLRGQALTIQQRILAAYQLDAGSRRIIAVLLLREMRLAGERRGAATSKLANDWSALAWLLQRCAVEVSGHDARRAEELRSQSRAALAVCFDLRFQVTRRRPGQGMSATQVVGRGWSPRGRVIDVTTTAAPRAVLAEAL